MYNSIILACSNFLETPYQEGELIADRYKVEMLLGQGGYGRTYLVMDLQVNRVAVLKMLRLHRRYSPRGVKMFQREPVWLKRLSSPAFPAVFETGHDKGTPFFTMEFINGKTFEQLIFSEGKTYGHHEVFRIGYDLVKIIGNIHDEGIVHRDIRIPNVMVVEGSLKLIDFGLAQDIAVGGRKKASDKIAAFQTDFLSLGHYLLYLLYSNYTAEGKTQKRSWEEELDIPFPSKKAIRKLLLIESPYENWKHICSDIYHIMNT